MASTGGDGVRITKVGLWLGLFAAIVAIAATNTGNNALYMVVASILGLFCASWVVTRVNGSALDLRLRPIGELFAKIPGTVELELTSGARWFPRLQLQVQVAGLRPTAVPRLGRRGEPEAVFRARSDLVFDRRGLRPPPPLRVSSLFPLGFYRASRHYGSGEALLVYPEVFDRPAIHFRQPGELGDDSTRRAGWGHDVHSLRGFRPGDDPRSIHWKQTARAGELIYKGREAEESRRLSIVVDNRAGELETPIRRRRFERMVSEAATAALDYLDRGFEVELVTSDRHLRFAAGPGQRHQLLECLALLESLPVTAAAPVPSDPTTPALRLALDAPPGAAPPGAAPTLGSP